MDNKLNLAGALLTRLREEYGMSLEAQAYCQYGLTSSELDAVILAWKERVKHDLIKPTSTVHARGEEMVSSFVNGGEPHQASDWVPYLEVVPHAEYPSGSASICQAVAQYLDSFIQVMIRPPLGVTDTQLIVPETYSSYHCGRWDMYGRNPAYVFSRSLR